MINSLSQTPFAFNNNEHVINKSLNNKVKGRAIKGRNTAGELMPPISNSPAAMIGSRVFKSQLSSVNPTSIQSPTGQSVGVRLGYKSGHSRSELPGYLKLNNTSKETFNQTNVTYDHGFETSPQKLDKSLERYESNKQIDLKSVQFKNISKALVKQLDRTHCAVYQEEIAPAKADVIRYQNLCKDVKIDFVQEYKQHLQTLNCLDEFERMKLNWDLAYFKSIIQSQIKNPQRYNPP